jgi:polo-like kinase 1
MRTSHAIMFRLSNKIVQVNFKDHTEILLNSESRYVTYVNKRGERSVMPLSAALDSNDAEMTKRLKYTKDILTTMLNNGNAGGGAAASGTDRNPTSSSGPLTTIGSKRSDTGSRAATSQDRRGGFANSAART